MRDRYHECIICFSEHYICRHKERDYADIAPKIVRSPDPVGIKHEPHHRKNCRHFNYNKDFCSFQKHIVLKTSQIYHIRHQICLKSIRIYLKVLYHYYAENANIL